MVLDSRPEHRGWSVHLGKDMLKHVNISFPSSSAPNKNWTLLAWSISTYVPYKEANYTAAKAIFSTNWFWFFLVGIFKWFVKLFLAAQSTLLTLTKIQPCEEARYHHPMLQQGSLRTESDVAFVPGPVVLVFVLE